MQVNRILIFVCILAFLPSPVLAEIDFFKEEIVLSYKEADFELTMLFESTPSGDFSYPLFYKVKDFRHRANFGNYTCSLIERPYGSEISCDFSQATGGRFISFFFSSADTIQSIAGKKIFRTDVKVPVKTEKLVVRVWLLEGLVLMPEIEETTTLVPYSPLDGTKGSDGRRIYVAWTREELARGEGLSLSLVYEHAFPTRENSFPFILASGFLLLILLFILRLGSRIGQLPLREDERAVVEVLRRYGGSVKQRKIVRETGLNKVKVSRLVKSLQDRGLITVKKIGRTNEITLKREIK